MIGRRIGALAALAVMASLLGGCVVTPVAPAGAVVVPPHWAYGPWGPHYVEGHWVVVP